MFRSRREEDLRRQPRSRLQWPSAVLSHRGFTPSLQNRDRILSVDSGLDQRVWIYFMWTRKPEWLSGRKWIPSKRKHQSRSEKEVEDEEDDEKRRFEAWDWKKIFAGWGSGWRPSFSSWWDSSLPSPSASAVTADPRPICMRSLRYSHPLLIVSWWAVGARICVKVLISYVLHVFCWWESDACFRVR